MKTLALALSLALSISGLSRADWVIVEKQDAAGQANESKTQIKGDKARTDVGEQMSVILDASTTDITMLMHGQKSFMKVNPDKMKGLMAMAQQLTGNGGGEATKPVATGEKEKVGEWDAEIYTWQGKMGAGKYWIATNFEGADEIREIQSKLMKGLGAGNPLAGMAPDPMDFPGMVVKSEMTIMGQTAKTELVSATKEDVSDDIFAMPEGYQEMKMPSIPGLGQ